MNECGSAGLYLRPGNDAPITHEKVDGAGRQQVASAIADEQRAAALLPQ